MGLGALAEICAKLIAHGVRPEMPIAAVQQGTTPDQRVVTGTLETLPDIAARSRLKSPCMIIVGEVVSLHDKLAWFQPERCQDHQPGRFTPLPFAHADA